MKRFLLWLLITAVLFTGVAVPTHLFLSAHPRRIAVAVDTSYGMQAARQAVQRELAALGASRYALFSLLTDKVKVHGWQETLDAGSAITFYGPRDFAAFSDTKRYPELADADSVILITGGGDTSALHGLRGLRVVVVP
jgi:hypothetical protein